MSWQATAWADGLAYDRVGPLAYRVLIKLANVAAADGTRAFRSNTQVAQELGVSVRSVQRGLRELEQQGLIAKGDQRLVQHLRADRRPRVYDLAMPKTTAKDMALIEAWNGATELSTDATTGRQKDTDGMTAAVVTYKNDRTITKETKPSTVQPCPTTGDAHRINRKLRYCADCLTPTVLLEAPNRKEGAA